MAREDISFAAKKIMLVPELDPRRIKFGYLAWAHRSLGDGGMASTHGVPNQESKINCAWPIALLIASAPPYDTQPTGFEEVISDDGHEARQLEQ